MRNEELIVVLNKMKNSIKYAKILNLSQNIKKFFS